MNVSVVIVTRGDHDLAPIIGQDWPDAVQEIVVWDNSSEDRRNLGVYGRYAAIAETNHELIFVQDDDCILEAATIAGLLDCWDEMHTLARIEDTADAERFIVSNMPESRWGDYPDSCLLGWGAVFPRYLPEAAWGRMTLHYGLEFLDHLNDRREWFLRTCDVAFTTLTPHIKQDLGFAHLPWAEGQDRMFKQPGHKAERDEMLELARKVRDGD